MSAENGFHLIGNLTRDSELKYTPNGTPVCNFSIANNKKWKGSDGTPHEEVSYFECTLFGKLGETLSQYLLKGKKVAIEGEMKQERWEKDGVSHSKHKFIIGDIKLLSSGGGDSYDRGDGDQQGGDRGQQRAPQGRNPAQRPPQTRASDPVSDDFSDDIPF